MLSEVFKMGKILLIISMIGFLLTLVLLVIIFVKKKNFNFHEIWGQAINGDKLSRAYCYLSLGSFFCAVSSVFFLKGGI